jgi:hypothetical protein
MAGPGRPKTGGRQKGTPNKASAGRIKALNEMRISGLDPVTFFSQILRREDAPLDLRFQAAKELAPYMHPKLSSIEARSGGVGHEERLARLQHMLETTEDAPHTTPRGALPKPGDEGEGGGAP